MKTARRSVQLPCPINKLCTKRRSDLRYICTVRRCFRDLLDFKGTSKSYLLLPLRYLCNLSPGGACFANKAGHCPRRAFWVRQAEKPHNTYVRYAQIRSPKIRSSFYSGSLCIKPHLYSRPDQVTAKELNTLAAAASGCHIYVCRSTTCSHRP